MTKTSFTAMQAMVSMPFSLRAEDLDLKPGRCSLEQVGVKAPGTEKRATFFLGEEVGCGEGGGAGGGHYGEGSGGEGVAYFDRHGCIRLF
mmetsp:Transcript_30997/g.63263  ORF Transcript_30997/g.63263 Transcript_30997/m.63263 type:complete len:90 (-) Transcript_30997:39-308(-)